jgi:ubiquinone/menaquinone biosynthesis C-methylase UbiE
VREPDAAFADPRLAVLYDAVDDDRSDLDAYVALVAEVGARTVVDIGCGTGSLAARLTASSQGLHVVGVDPAAASLEVARAKVAPEQVTWVRGDATALLASSLRADLAVMTGNVAQVFVDDEDWHQTLAAAHAVLRPGGWLAFETRRPEVRDWENWGTTARTVDLPDGRTGLLRTTVTTVALPLVTFESGLEVDGEVLRSASTLRFRDRAEVASDLDAHGFDLVDVREAPDRPGKEMVFLARRRATGDRTPGC